MILWFIFVVQIGLFVARIGLLKASRVGFSQAQRFLTGAVIPRAHGPAPAPSPSPPPIVYFWLSGLSPEWEHCFQGNSELLGAKWHFYAQERRILASLTLLGFLGRSWEYAGEASRGYLALGIAVGGILN